MSTFVTKVGNLFISLHDDPVFSAESSETCYFSTVSTLLLLTIVSVQPYLLATNRSFSLCLSESQENAKFRNKNLKLNSKLSKYQNEKESIPYCLSS